MIILHEALDKATEKIKLDAKLQKEETPENRPDLQ